MKPILLYVSTKDIKNGGVGSRNCPIAQSLNRQRPRERAYWGVGTLSCNLWPAWPASTLTEHAIERYTLGRAAQRLVRQFDNTGRAGLKAQHVRLYPAAV